MKISEAGVEFVKQFEGFSATPYPDPVGKNTIGYGHLIKPGETFDTVTENQAIQLLGQDLLWAESVVNRAVLVTLNQNQFDALVDFVFNVGSANFHNSLMLSNLNQGDFDSAADEFKFWDHSGGVEIEGLERRREAERVLFCS
jgi:lysozyme